MRARISKHGAPCGDIARHAKSQKTQTGFGNDRGRHREGANHERCLDQVRNDVLAQDVTMGGAQGSRGIDEVSGAQAQRLRARHTAKGDPTLEHKRDDQDGKALPKEGDERDGEKQGWESPHHLNSFLHQQINAASKIA